MEAIKILQEIREQIERARDYNNYVEIKYNRAYYARINRALLELECIAYKNMSINEILDNKKISYSIIDDKEMKDA